MTELTQSPYWSDPHLLQVRSSHTYSGLIHWTTLRITYWISNATANTPLHVRHLVVRHCLPCSILGGRMQIMTHFKTAFVYLCGMYHKERRTQRYVICKAKYHLIEVIKKAKLSGVVIEKTNMAWAGQSCWVWSWPNRSASYQLFRNKKWAVFFGRVQTRCYGEGFGSGKVLWGSFFSDHKWPSSSYNKI